MRRAVANHRSLHTYIHTSITPGTEWWIASHTVTGHTKPGRFTMMWQNFVERLEQLEFRNTPDATHSPGCRTCVSESTQHQPDRTAHPQQTINPTRHAVGRRRHRGLHSMTRRPHTALDCGYPTAPCYPPKHAHDMNEQVNTPAPAHRCRCRSALSSASSSCSSSSSSRRSSRWQ